MFKINYSKYHRTTSLRICSALFILTSLYGIGACTSISSKHISFGWTFHFIAILCRTQHAFIIRAKKRYIIKDKVYNTKVYNTKEYCFFS